jgi:hypothetical protein
MAYPNGGFLEVTCRYEVNGQKLMNVFHISPIGTQPGKTVSVLTSEFLDLNAGPGNGTIGREWADTISAAAEVTMVTAQLVYPERWALQWRELSIQGARGGQCSAQNVSGAIEFAGDLAGRKRVGGIRLGAVANDDYDAGLLVAGYKTQLDTVATFLRAGFTDGVNVGLEYELVIANKTLVPNSNPKKYIFSGSTVVTRSDVKDELRTMRRRTRGIGI